MSKLVRKFIYLLLATSMLTACTRVPDEPVKIGTNDWVGYRPLFLLETVDPANAKRMHLVELPSNSEVMRHFRNNVIDVATLTLDETLLLLQDGFEVKIILVMDISNGGDQVIAQSQYQNIQELKGKRIGVEKTALGAYVLSRALDVAGIFTSEITTVDLEYAEHENSFKKKRVDAVVTFEPVATVLRNAGGNTVFDSKQIPGEIVDVMVVHKTFYEKNRKSIQKIIDGWFSALDYIDKQPQAYAQLADISGLAEADYRYASQGIRFPARAESINMLTRETGSIEQAIMKMKKLMLKQNLLVRDVSISGLITNEFLY